MDLKQLKALVTVVETGSVTRAAELLHLVQPAVTRQVRALEHELGVPLFERTRHGMRPTAAGLSLPPDAFTIGIDLAVTPGAVVLRTPMLELIQYQPVTETVRDVPLLIVLDLAPGRSMIEYLVSQGQQVLVISWRNPDARHASCGILRGPAAAVLRARPPAAGLRHRESPRTRPA